MSTRHPMLDGRLRRQVVADARRQTNALFSLLTPEHVGIIGFTVLWPFQIILRPLAQLAFELQGYRALKRGKAPHPEEG